MRAIWAMAATALALGGTGMAAFAQEPASNEAIVTVTAVRGQERTTLDTPVPVDVFSGAELQQTGAVGDEFGQALATVAPAFNFPRQSNSGTSDHIRAGQLRGLSPDQMLVLVNGKRRNPSAVINSETKIGRGSAAVDFNTIPLGAVKRVEILRDGAGAQYGSDAIAGVVNVILDDAPHGGDLSVTVGENLTHLDPVDQDIRDGKMVTVQASNGASLGADGFFRFGADYQHRDSTNRAGFDQVPFFVDQTPDNLALQGKRNYTEGDPDTDALDVWFNGEAAAGPGKFYASGTFSQRRTRGGATFFRYPDGTSNVKSIYPNGFRPESTGDDDNLWFTGGYRWQAAGWDWDGSLTYGRDAFDYGVEHSLNASLGSSSPTKFHSATSDFDQITATLGASRDVNVGALASPLHVSAGVEARQEAETTFAGDGPSSEAGPFDADIGAQGGLGLTPADVADIDRTVLGAYVDLSADVTDKLFVNAAARYEDYDDFGDQLTGKLSAIYKLTEALSLRAAVSNSFRAPALAQVAFSDTSLNFGANRTLVRTRTLRVDDPIAKSLGAKELEPETSLNYSAGVTAKLPFGATLTVDAFRIDVDNRITLSDRFFGPGLEAFVQAQPGGADVQSVRFFTNAIDTRTEGADVVANWRGDALGGSLGLSGAYSYAETDIRHFAPTPAALTNLDPTFALIGVEEINTVEEAAPRYKATLTATYDRGIWEGLVRVSRYGSEVRTFNFGGGFEPTQRYGAETQVDVEGSAQVNDRVRVSLGASNLLDEYPDLSSGDINYFGNLPYDILSPIGINGRFVYAKLSTTF